MINNTVKNTFIVKKKQITRYVLPLLSQYLELPIKLFEMLNVFDFYFL